MPGNPSRRAADFLRILRRSEEGWGEDTARRSKVRRRLRRFGQIADGTAVGHERRDAKPRTPPLFLNEDPWVISNRPATRQVLRILHRVVEFRAIYPPRG